MGYLLGNVSPLDLGPFDPTRDFSHGVKTPHKEYAKLGSTIPVSNHVVPHDPGGDSLSTDDVLTCCLDLLLPDDPF